MYGEYGDSFVACDQCGAARALWIVALPSGRTLAMCGHHKNANQTALLAAGALIYEAVSC